MSQPMTAASKLLINRMYKMKRAAELKALAEASIQRSSLSQDGRPSTRGEREELVLRKAELAVDSIAPVSDFLEENGM